jgi:hypothetical protein
VDEISWSLATYAARRVDAGESSRLLAGDACDVTAGCAAVACRTDGIIDKAWVDKELAVARYHSIKYSYPP